MRAIFATVAFSVAALAFAGSGKAIHPPSQATPPAAGAGKIPITTSSDAARQEYIEGRSLAERLRVTDSIAHFDKAISLDPDFGLAHLARANASPNGTEFLDHLKKAVAVADRLSDGEKLQIAAANAGMNARGPEQRKDLEQLVAAYPQDERAHFALGVVLFGQQDPAAAIEQFKKATEIAPDYSAPYNQMGYAYRQLRDYANAETAFKKYVELIPNDPNPYDSYAELLLKTGRFEESIAQYRKALSIDDHFLNSHLGITADLMYQNKPTEAAAEAAQIVKKARTDAETRTGMFATTSLDVYQGKLAEALKSLDDQYAVAQKSNDTLGMVGDLQAKAAIYIEMNKAADAQAMFDKAIALVDASSLPDAVKANQHLFHHNALARAALVRGDLAGARRESDEFGKVALKGGPFQVRQAHELAGMIALQSKDWDTALSELQQANQQNVYNVYRQCLAYQGKGDTTKATEACGLAAKFYPLPELNFSFIHAKAAKGAGKT
jgi:tetratricopeptide (TPR) repeat protein